ncbi:unnamed protein product [Litomosoides sigmodontis]|uniref:Uncharacterized protein n=1 Tax=Litomosoides sigmodontis TaxID=42156 RepID=A0A3P6SKR0_LITSI|nr:unnamed protein product [Litomosoides sigmodontis]
MWFKIGGTLLLNMRMPQQICCAKLDDESPGSKSIIRWKTSTYFLASLLYAIQTEYVKRALLGFLKRNCSIPDNRNVYLVIHFREPLISEIDYRWNYRISAICVRGLELERLLWILSTFGGALSAMGDYYRHFAEKAELVSYSQLRLANDIGDPILISRCKLYISISLMQTKRYRAASKIIRQQYSVAKALKNEFLFNCCEGVWAKLRGTIENCKRMTQSASITSNEKFNKYQ